MEEKAGISRRALGTVTIFLISISVVSALSLYSLWGPADACGGAGGQAPSSIQGTVSTIESNSTFISLESGRQYNFASVAQQQMHYSNGTAASGFTVVEFTCGTNQCNPPIDAVVSEAGRVLQVYAQGVGMSFGNGHVISTC
jgi:hypothetical protein